MSAPNESLEKLTERANEAYNKMEELRKKLPDGKGFTDAADEKAWDESSTVYDETIAKIDEIRKGDAVRNKLDEIQKRRDQEAKERGDDDTRRDINRDEEEQRGGKATREDAEALFGAWARAQYGIGLNNREKALCQQFQFNPRQRRLKLQVGGTTYARALQSERNAVNDAARRNLEARALTISATSGGDMIGRGIMPEFEAAMLDFSGVLQASELLRTNSGEPLDWPTMNDTGNEGALLAINTQAASNVDPATSEMTLAAYKGTSKIVLVPTELIEDESSGFVATLPAVLGERIGRMMETYGTTGTGSSQPNGVVTASALGVTAAGVAAITADELIGLEHSVDPAYRSGAAFMLHDTVIKALRLLKDSEGRYLWASGLREARPDSLLGYRVFRNQKMASSLAASAKTVLFGDFRYYKVRMVRDVRFYRMSERYRDYDQDGFVAFVRWDSNLLNAGVAPVRHLIQAAA